jgi:enediyne biosynthesis protein E4
LKRCLPLLWVLALAACGPGEPVPEPAPAPVAPPFVDVTAAAGLDFRHVSGASVARYLPETMGAGGAIFDADGDGWADLFLVGGRAVEPGGPVGGSRLYRNRRDGTFEDVTAAAGVGAAILGMGVAVGDLENDGDLDLVVTGVGEDRLYRNDGGGRFTDVARAWGLGPPGFSSSAAFLDYDRDGWLDLFVARYVRWSAASDLPCMPDGRTRIYCTPELFAAEPSRLYRNVEGRRFEDVTARAGLDRLPGKTLGVVPIDHDGDGWPDLALANDTSPNQLFVNQGDGGFEEVAGFAGIAVSDSGSPRGGMGIDSGDLDGDGRADLVIGNFAQEMVAVYQGSADGLFVDESAQLGVGLPTLMQVTFGALMLDQDGDGWLDLLLANGHIEPEIGRFRRGQSHAQPLQLFRNRGAGEGGFTEVVTEGAWRGPWVGRGLASGDVDRDGDPDVLLTQNGGPARLLRNEANPTSWLCVRLVGTSSNRTGYGTRITAFLGERRLVRTVVSGRSYLSASEPAACFAWPGAAPLDRLEVLWPSGRTQTVAPVPKGQYLELAEPAAPPL